MKYDFYQADRKHPILMVECFRGLLMVKCLLDLVLNVQWTSLLAQAGPYLHYVISIKVGGIRGYRCLVKIS